MQMFRHNIFSKIAQAPKMVVISQTVHPIYFIFNTKYLNSKYLLHVDIICGWVRTARRI